MSTPRSVDDALAWLRGQVGVPGWAGLCLKSNRMAYGLPGGTADADAAWEDCPDQYRRPWSDNPPRGAIVHWAIGEHGHVAVSAGNGRILGTDLPTYDTVGDAAIGDPARKWGATPRGYCLWLNGYPLPVAGYPSTPLDPDPGGETMDYAQLATAKAGQRLPKAAWVNLAWPVEERDSSGIGSGGASLYLASRRFLVDVSLGQEEDAGRVSLRADVYDGERLVESFPVVSNGATDQARPAYVLTGYCGSGRKVRIAAKAADTSPLVSARCRVLAWS